MNILHVLWERKQGGAEFQAEAIANRISENNHISLLYAFGKSPRTVIRDSKKTIIYLQGNKAFPFFYIFKFLIFIIRHRFEIIHFHIVNNFFMIIACIFSKAYLFYTEHSIILENRIKERIFYRFISSHFHIVVLCQGFKKIAKEYSINENRIRIIPNFITLDRFYYYKSLLENENNIKPFDKINKMDRMSLIERLIRLNNIEFYNIKHNTLDSEITIIGFAGRLEAQKNILEIMEIFKKIYFKRKNIVFFVAGTGKYEYLIYKTELPMIYATKISDMSFFYPVIDIFIISSLFEGLPSSLIESSLFERAIIAGECPGCLSSIITNDENGYIIPRGADYIERFSGLVVKLIDDPILRTKLGRNGFKKVKKSFLTDNIESILQYYMEVIKS